MDQNKDEPPAVNSTNKLNAVENLIISIEEEEEEELNEKHSLTIVNVETKPSLLDEVTQTDTTVFEKMQNDLLNKKESNNSIQSQTEITINQADSDQNKYDNFMEREFYPQFKANEQKIDTQIEKIDQAIEKLRCLTNSFNQNVENDPSTSTSASIDRLSETLQVDPVLVEKDHKVKKKSHKKLKTKASLKPSTPISKAYTYDTNIRKKSRKRSIKKHKRYLSPLKMTIEKRMDMLSKKKNLDKNNPENQIYIPKGNSPFDPIVLRSGYPIVFDYEPKEQIRQERIPHGPMKTLYKNGDIKYEFRDGTVRIKTNTGFIYTYYTNGDKQQEFPDGVNAYRYNSNGSVEFRCPDKTLMYFFEDGQIEEHFSNGETRVRFPNRSEVRIFADNSFVYKDRNGTKKEGKIFNDHMKINPDSPIAGNSSGISTPTPRKKVPTSTSMASPAPISQDLVHDNNENA